MRFYNINKKTTYASFKEAAVLGQPPEGGLYFPEFIPKFPNNLLTDIEGMENVEIAFKVIQPYVGDSISDEVLYRIVAETIDFPIPLKTITGDVSVLELFHGPTLAFKDIGARFMSRCLSYYIKNDPKFFARKGKVTVLVATSGDTGGAVANGFNEVEGIDVVILYPAGKVSQVQEKQLTTNGKNVYAIKIEGTFDDCQQIVKKAFKDEQLGQHLYLTSANSINIARWLPQQFYYLFAWKQWMNKQQPVIVSVPSGNFGNVCAGLLAQSSGLPVIHFIAACNANNVVPNFFATQTYRTKQAVPTLSNAMDVGDPSNFIRVMEIFEQNFSNLKQHLTSYSITDDETKKTIKELYDEHSYVADPHGAVGFAALKKYLNIHGGKGIFFETAHPVKFKESIEDILGEKISFPNSIKVIMEKPSNAIQYKADFQMVKDFLMTMS